MTEDDKWNSYFYEGTNVLINNLGIKNYDKLKKKEATGSANKLLELVPSSLDMEIDKNRLNYIHWYIFKDIYPFAGKYRDVNMRKVGGTGGFFLVNELKDDPSEDIDKELNKLFKEIKEMLKGCYNKSLFCDVLARLYTQLIFIHPYREGNGRTIREFVREFSIVYSDKLGIGQMELDWSLISKEELNRNIDVAHNFPDETSLIFKDALVSINGKKR